VNKLLISFFVLSSILFSNQVKAQLSEDGDTDEVLRQSVQACEENREKTLIIRPYDLIGRFNVRTTITCNNNTVFATRFLVSEKNPKLTQSILFLRINHIGKKISFSAENVDVTVNYKTK
jgi:hypothetical protein